MIILKMPESEVMGYAIRLWSANRSKVTLEEVVESLLFKGMVSLELGEGVKDE